MKNYVQRIADMRPSLVLVEKTVSRIAQDMLLEHGITLVINVKPVSVPPLTMALYHSIEEFPVQPVSVTPLTMALYHSVEEFPVQPCPIAFNSVSGSLSCSRQRFRANHLVSA